MVVANSSRIIAINTRTISTKTITPIAAPDNGIPTYSDNNIVIVCYGTGITRDARIALVGRASSQWSFQCVPPLYSPNSDFRYLAIQVVN